MFLKRTFVLAAGILLVIGVYIAYFEVFNISIEDRFTQARKENGVDHQTLTTQIASTPPPAIPAPAVAAAPPAGNTDAMPPVVSSDSTSNSAPAPAATDTSSTDTSAAPASSSDSNVIIGPMPPSAAPESAPASSTPSSSDTNTSGAMPPASTMVYPHGLNLIPLLIGAYASLPGGGIQAQDQQPIIINLPPAAPAPSPAPAPAPATNSPAAAPPAATNTVPPPGAVEATPSTATTNAPVAAPAVAAAVPTEPGTMRPLPVEASVIVLLYHQFVPAGVAVSPKLQWTLNQDVFETEMKYIHDNGYHVIPMSDLLAFLRHEKGLPPNSVVITIDDGYKSAIVYAAPILKKYGYPWTFFVYPDFITVAEGKGAASWNDLKALQADGVDIECHSMTHPMLTSHHQKVKGVWHNFSPEEYDQWLTNETSGAKAEIEQKLGTPVTCFAYPYGAYNKQVEAKAIAAGFQAIFTVADNPVRSTTSMDSIGRYTITRSVVKDFYAYLRQGALGLAAMDPAPGATITNPRPVITVVLSYAGTIDPKTIETSVRDFGDVKHDFDPKTSTLRLYLPRDLIQPVNLVNIRARDAQTGQVMVANWHFNYVAPNAGVHAPLGVTPPATKGASAAPVASAGADPASAPAANSPNAVPAAPAAVPTSSASATTNEVAPPKMTVGAH